MTDAEIPQALGQLGGAVKEMPCDNDEFSLRSSVPLRFLLPGQFCGAGFISPGMRKTHDSFRYVFSLKLSYDR
jgi:hypothetical protein